MALNFSCVCYNFITEKKEFDMTKLIFAFVISLIATDGLLAATHTITNSGFTFSPATITVAPGDTVNFVLASIHNAEEVSQSTWDANGNTSNGGFQTPFGGGTVVLLQPGTYYYVCQTHASMGMKGIINVTSTTDVPPGPGGTPERFTLQQNYPNPFNPSTSISFSIPEISYVTIKIYNLIGVEIQTLTERSYNPGNYIVTWNASNNSSGVYFYQLIGKTSADSREHLYTETRRFILLK
jgi:plastocyanin